MCRDAGHEIASHGYAHILAYKVGPNAFREDITLAKDILENTIGDQVRGFRAPGFGITKKAPWAFDVIKESGYQYDSSVFPASRGHGGIADSPLGPYFIETRSGHLLEIPMSIVEILGHRTSLFGGGYLRLANKLMIKWGIGKLRTAGRPLIVYNTIFQNVVFYARFLFWPFVTFVFARFYEDFLLDELFGCGQGRSPRLRQVHPREIDPAQPHLPLSLFRQFKCYVNLNSTLPKLKWLCKNYALFTMLEMVENYIRSFYLESRMIPVIHPQNMQASGKLSPESEERTYPVDPETFRSRLLLVERAMADFLDRPSPAFSPDTEHSGIEADSNSNIIQQLSITSKKQDSEIPNVVANTAPL